MAAVGHAGVENVSKHVNGYFKKLINKIYNHSGDVLKIAVTYPPNKLKYQRVMLFFVCSLENSL
jgi:hypothetical protein